MALVIDAVTVPLLPGPAGWAGERVRLFDQRYMPAGVLRTGILPERWWRWEWSAQTIPLDRTVLNALEAVLRAPGPKVASGYPIGGEALSMDVYVRDVSRTEATLTGLAGLTFRVREATPVFS